MADNFDTGHPSRAETFAAASAVMDPVAAPTVLVFNDVASLVESLRFPEGDLPIEREQPITVRDASPMPPPTAAAAVNGWSPVADQAAPPAPAPTAARAPSPPAAPPVPAPEPSIQTGPVEVITDEERTRYGLLLDRAAERGLLDPADYEIRLRELAEATSTAQMVEIVAELPAFAAGPAATRSRRSIQSANRAYRPAGQRRRMIMWAVMGLLVVVALVSLVILALSAERLSRSRNSSLPPTPVATRTVSAPHL